MKGNINFGSVSGENERGINIPLAVGWLSNGLDGNYPVNI